MDSSWGMDMQARRVAHRALMGTGAIVMIIAYVFMLVAHSTNGKREYLGYDFKNGKWKEWKRIAHSLIGTVVVILVLAQGVMGAKKLKALTESNGSNRIFTFHGQMGKIIIAASLIQMVLGTLLMQWSTFSTFLVIVLSLACAALGTVMPKAITGAEKSPGADVEAETIGLMDRKPQ
jgi:hypothetical protein